MSTNNDINAPIPFSIANGGTAATTAPNALTNLGALPIAGGTMTGNLILNSDPTNALGAVTKQYADAISAGLDFKDPAYAGSTANLNATYSNGVSGIGATLTNAGSLTAFSIDGVSPPLNSRILVKNQTSDFQNGIYSLTTVGSGVIVWILTRTTDYDQSSQIAPGDFVLIENGSVNTNTAWIQTQTVNTIGTDSIDFVQFGNPGTVTSVSGTINVITVTNGTSAAIVNIAPTYIGQTSITNLGTITTGVWNGSLIPLAYGGTNANLTASNGGIFYSTASAGAILAGTATANQVLLSGSSTTPSWSTATYPATTTANQILYSSSANTITGLATANNGVLITSSGGVPSIGTTLPTGVQTNITELGTITTGVWNGSLIPLAYGGTNANLTASNGGIFYSTASAGAVLAGTATADRVLLSGSSTTPSWSTATYPATTTANQILYSSSANTITGLATANNGVLLTSGSGVPSIGTATVSVGGTGNTTFTAYSVLCGGTTSTGSFQNVSGLGTSGQALLSSGASALPTWGTPLFPNNITGFNCGIAFASSQNSGIGYTSPFLEFYHNNVNIFSISAPTSSVDIFSANSLYFWNLGTTNYVGFKGGASTTNTVWTLPLVDATVSGQALTSNAAGTLSWTTTLTSEDIKIFSDQLEMLRQAMEDGIIPLVHDFYQSTLSMKNKYKNEVVE